MKKLLLFSALLIFACSSDDSSSPTYESSDKISKIVLKSVSTNQSECDEQLVEFYGSEIEHNYIYSNNIATTLNYSAESYSCQTNDLVERNVFSLLQSQLENFYNSFQYENGYLTSYNLGGDTVSDYEIYEWSEGNLSRRYDSSSCEDPSNCHYYEIHYSEQINHTKYEFGFFWEGDFNGFNVMFKDQYRGNSSVNLPSEVYYIQDNGGLYPSYVDKNTFYNYEFDFDGKPTKFLVDVFIDNGEVNSDDYNEISYNFQYTFQVEITYTN